MRFLRRRALVCDAKVGGLGPAAAAAAEDGSMARRQFLLVRCCFFFSLSVDSIEEEAEKSNRKYD